MAVATDEFMGAARAQAAALGRPDFDAVYVRHPVQDQTRDELEARADAVVEEIVGRLTGLDPGPRQAASPPAVHR